ncbi:Hpt domain-containing protein [Roseateles sp. SL47]|jgi:histidine phosphotransfer protein HptB|uniref:Hpt domain-containing protein n=1 Tax=Roseateles sp. SL47 TaxID=2995138 RepID=UPI00226F3BB7|nr:Hpt domain-containing protein [Roseateles sp. SL47]WAC72514.1 Hpt domain-containing protein [Roseateles sp. SL47]
MSPDHILTMPPRLKPTSSVLDEQALARLRELDPGGNNHLLERVIGAFLKSLEQQEGVLGQGLAPAPDLAAVRHVAHTLKSASASLGAMGLSQRCAEIEAVARAGEADRLPELTTQVLAEIDAARQAMQQLLPPAQ